MARNKLIYSLAEWSLVVSTAAGEGGTWTGAIEALRDAQVPVFVHVGDNVPLGNKRLG